MGSSAAAAASGVDDIVGALFEAGAGMPNPLQVSEGPTPWVPGIQSEYWCFVPPDSWFKWLAECGGQGPAPRFLDKGCTIANCPCRGDGTMSWTLVERTKDIRDHWWWTHTCGCGHTRASVFVRPRAKTLYKRNAVDGSLEEVEFDELKKKERNKTDVPKRTFWARAMTLLSGGGYVLKPSLADCLSRMSPCKCKDQPNGPTGNSVDSSSFSGAASPTDCAPSASHGSMTRNGTLPDSSVALLAGEKIDPDVDISYLDSRCQGSVRPATGTRYELTESDLEEIAGMLEPGSSASEIVQKLRNEYPNPAEAMRQLAQASRSSLSHGLAKYASSWRAQKKHAVTLVTGPKPHIVTATANYLLGLTEGNRRHLEWQSHAAHLWMPITLQHAKDCTMGPRVEVTYKAREVLENEARVLEDLLDGKHVSAEMRRPTEKRLGTIKGLLDEDHKAVGGATERIEFEKLAAFMRKEQVVLANDVTVLANLHGVEGRFVFLPALAAAHPEALAKLSKLLLGPRTVHRLIVCIDEQGTSSMEHFADLLFDRIFNSPCGVSVVRICADNGASASDSPRLRQALDDMEHEVIEENLIEAVRKSSMFSKKYVSSGRLLRSLRGGGND